MEWFGRNVELMPDWADHAGESFDVMLIAEGEAAGATRRAVAIAGGRVLATATLADAAAALDGIAADRPVVLVEATGADPALLAAILPRLDAAASALDLPVVTVFAEHDIDLVAGALIGGGVELLCAPSQADLVVALVMGGRRAGGPVLADVREGEAERLRRLNDEVARIAAVLAQLAMRNDPARDPGRDVFDRRGRYDAGPGDAGEIDAQPVRQAIRARRMRDMFFGEGIFEDPAWDMLLDLFAAELEGARVSVSSLCIAAAVAPTTALRWIGKLTDAGLFERRPDPVDRRRAFMALSAKGSAGMRGYWGAVRRAGLAVG